LASGRKNNIDLSQFKRTIKNTDVASTGDNARESWHGYTRGNRERQVEHARS